MAKQEENTIVQETSFQEEKIGINTEFIMKKYYSKCGHSKNYIAEMPKEFINKTKEEIVNEYPEWNIEEFSSSKLVLSQEINSLCDEHYVIKKEGKNISVYYQNQFDEMQLYKDTNISTEYLTEKDKDELENGIYVYGKDKLNSVLEDYE